MPRKVARLIALGILGSAVISFTPAQSQAQWVDVIPGGGIYVSAPFVRVYVGPDGGTSVRAPFTVVDTPGRRHRDAGRPPAIIERYPMQPSLPTAEELAALDDETLWQTLHATADWLHDDLARFETGASWQRYLRLPDDVLANASSTPDERRDALTMLLERFRYVATERQYALIARLPTFAAMQAVLTELASRPNESLTARDTLPEELPLPPPNRPSREQPFLKPVPGP